MLKATFYAFFMWWSEGSKNNFWIQAAPFIGAGTVFTIYFIWNSQLEINCCLLSKEHRSNFKVCFLSSNYPNFNSIYWGAILITQHCSIHGCQNHGDNFTSSVRQNPSCHPNHQQQLHMFWKSWKNSLFWCQIQCSQLLF